MTARFTRAARSLFAWLPTRSLRATARDLVRRANAARDAQRYQAASALYEEALRLAPTAPIHKQCGHMFKESGDHEGAERHYLQALHIAPNDADLALQLGHFYKVGGRLDDAERCYAQAVALVPGWGEALKELASVRSGFGPDGPAVLDRDADRLAPELLPGLAAHAGPAWRETIQVRRLGASRLRSRGGYQRVLRGIEAIRGYCISTSRLSDLEVLLDGEIVRREPLRAHPLPGAAGFTKYVFNAWHDFSTAPPGETQVELRFIDERGRAKLHRATLLILADVAEDAASDTIVGRGDGSGRPIEDQVNARPSIVRPAARTLLAEPIRTILVQRVDQLGDLVCSVPALRRMREAFSEARIIGLVTPANAPLAETLGLFDAVMIADFPEDAREGRRIMSLPAQEKLRRSLDAYAFDLAIDLGEGGGSRPLLALSGARFLYGFKGREFPWLSAGMDIDAHNPANHLEIVAHSRKLLAFVEGLIALHRDSARPLVRTDLDRARLAKFGVDQARRFIVLHSGARLAYSRWPHFEALTARLVEATDLDVVLMSDDPAEETPPNDRVHRIAGRLDFDDFDALLSFAALFVGNDSGPKHLAALRGTPVVSLHMARLNWNEWGQEITGSIISRRVPCAGCAISSEPEECGKDFACIRLIGVDEVLSAALALL